MQSRRFLTGLVAPGTDPFRPLEPECGVVQFDQPLTPAQLERAGELVASRPDIELYVYDKATTDLNFLRYFPNIRRLHLALYWLEDISGFAHARDLQWLNFSNTKKKFSLRFVESLPRLTHLFLVGHKTDLLSVCRLPELTSFGLSGITVDDFSVFLPLKKLRQLYVFWGNSTNLSALPRFPELEFLSLMRISKLDDLRVLGELHDLRRLRLAWMRNVTSLPSLAALNQLDDVELDQMKGLTDLSPVAAAPALRRLAIGDMRHLKPDSFRCFLGHPRLERVLVETGKLSLDAEIIRMLPGVAREWSGSA